MAGVITDRKDAEAATAGGGVDVLKLVRGHYVTCVGRLASMSREQFVDVVETLGGKFTNAVNGIGAGVSLVVIGQAEWPLNRSGQVRPFLRQARVRKRRGRHNQPLQRTGSARRGFEVQEVSDSGPGR